MVSGRADARELPRDLEAQAWRLAGAVRAHGEIVSCSVGVSGGNIDFITLNYTTPPTSETYMFNGGEWYTSGS